MKIVQLADLTVSRKRIRLSHGKKTIQQTWTKKRRKNSWQKTMEIVTRKSRQHPSSFIDSDVRKNRRNFWKLRRKSRSELEYAASSNNSTENIVLLTRSWSDMK